jgi:hypothetical protein
VSVINWFYLDSDRIIPKRLTYDIEEDHGIHVQESDRMVNGLFLLLGGTLLASPSCIGRKKNLVTGWVCPPWLAWSEMKKRQN